MADRTLLKVDPKASITAGAKRISASVAKQLHEKLVQAAIEPGETCALSLRVALGNEDASNALVRLTEGVDFVRKPANSEHHTVFLTRKGFGRITEEIGKVQAEMKGGMQAAREADHRNSRVTGRSQWGNTGFRVEKSPDITNGRTR